VDHLNRREFLRTASIVTGALASAVPLAEGVPLMERDVAGAGYPIQPRVFSDVTLTDTFWKPTMIVDLFVS
jgi:hypothetical protein